MKLLLFMIFASLALISCKASKDKSSLSFGDGTRTIETLPQVTLLSFSRLKSSVLIPKCLECHSRDGGDAGDINLESHENVIANLEIIKSEVSSGSMPPKSRSKLTDKEKSSLLTWINAGGPLNGEVTPPPPTVEVISYEMVKAQVLAPRCIGCHSDSGGNRGDVNLETYDNVLAVTNSIESEIETGSMPPRNKPLTPDQKTLILKWIVLGTPKN